MENISDIANEQKKRVDNLIRLHDKKAKIKLDKEFFTLIKEYVNDTNILREQLKTLPDEDIKEKRSRIGKIANIIQNNNDSLKCLPDNDVEKNHTNLITYIHALCYNGHINNLETLISYHVSDIGFLTLAQVTPLNKESVKESVGDNNFEGLITLEGMQKMIDKRAQDTSSKDSSQWKEMAKFFDFVIKNKDGLVRVSLVDEEDNNVPAATMRHSSSIKRVADTDNPGPARG